MLSSDTSRKTPLVPSLQQIAGLRAADAIMAQAQELPCQVTAVTGQLVTVSIQVFGQPFSGAVPNITVPIATSIYDWWPVRVGDLGVLKKSDAYLGAISGIGGGTANFTRRGNLSTLYFQPVSNMAWTLPAVAGGNATVRVVQGPAGVGLQNLAGDTKVLVNKDGVNINVQGMVTVDIKSDHVTITVPSGKRINMTAGGTLSPVMTVAGISPVLFADGP